MFTRTLRGSIEPRLSRLIGILMFSLLTTLAGTGWAQVSTASLNGTVQDKTGAVVPGAKIEAVQTETNLTTETVSGQDGSFRISSIPVGPYVIRVTKDGFEAYKQEGIVLTVGQVATLQITLTVGAATQNVVVTAEAPAVESTESTIQSVVEEKVVSELPLNGRNPAALMYTAAGVTDATINPVGTNANSTVAEEGSVLTDESAPTTNGIRPGGTYFSLDGAGNVDPFSVIGGPFPNPDATQEFSVVTGSYGARYVSAPGGAVNIVTKSGTNQIHGSAFEFVRNGFFNAENYFATVPDTLKRNQFGFAAGGPILKDKLFAFGFVSANHLSGRKPLSILTSVSSLRRKTCSKGSSRARATGNIVQLPVSTVAANLMKYIPPPNYAHPGADLDHYNTTIPNDTIRPRNGWRRSITISGQHRLFARYFTEHTRPLPIR